MHQYKMMCDICFTTHDWKVTYRYNPKNLNVLKLRCNICNNIQAAQAHPRVKSQKEIILPSMAGAFVLTGAVELISRIIRTAYNPDGLGVQTMTLMQHPLVAMLIALVSFGVLCRYCSQPGKDVVTLDMVEQYTCGKRPSSDDSAI